MKIDKDCPKCGTFNGGFGGRPDGKFCYECGFDLRIMVYTSEEHEKYVKRAYLEGYNDGKKAEANDTLRHIADALDPREVGV